MSKDSKPLRESVRAWMQEQWTQQEFGSSILMERLNEAGRQALGRDPDDVFRGLTEPLLERHATVLNPPSKRGGAAVEPHLPPEEIAEVLEQFEQLLGKPQDDGLSETPARLVVALREAADRLVHEWGQKLAELPVRLIEEPEFRLAGAEEIVRQMVASLEQALQHHEPLSKELTNRAVEAYTRLQALAVPSAEKAGASGVFRKVGSRGGHRPMAVEAVELLRSYPKSLYQSLVLRQAGNVLLTLRGHLADEMREINSCRVRLGELLRKLEEPADSAVSSAAQAAIGKHIFPTGCKDFAETATYFEDRLGPDALLVLDGRMEAMLKKQFTALVNVCLTSGNVLKNVETAMLQTAERFVAEQVGEINVAEMFRDHHPDAAQASQEIVGYFDDAAPELPAERRGNGAELCVLATPAGPAGDHFRELAATALPDVEWHAAPGDEDIVLYRELTNLPLSDLPQLGPLGQDAYRQMSAAEHFTPHCRCDVDFS